MSITGDQTGNKPQINPAELHKDQHEHIHRHISIWIDSYKDIFSDFDPRGFEERNISDDFLAEIKKVAHESDFKISEIKLLTPAKLRNPNDEQIIANRLHEFFSKYYHKFKNEQRIELRNSWLLTIGGLIIMICTAYISYLNYTGFFKHALITILEPAGWFMVWVGFDYLFFTTRKRKTELDFYVKLWKCKIVFADL